MPPLTAVGVVSNLPNTVTPSLFTWNLFISPLPSFSLTKNGPSNSKDPVMMAEPV